MLGGNKGVIGGNKVREILLSGGEAEFPGGGMSKFSANRRTLHILQVAKTLVDKSFLHYIFQLLCHIKLK